MLGLLLEVNDVSVVIGYHDAETGSFLHGNVQNGDGSSSVLFLVIAEHLVIVHLVDVVA